MSFPYHDPYWVDTAEFVLEHRATAERVLAPEIFWWRLEEVHSYAFTNEDPSAAFDWRIIHKGLLGEVHVAAIDAMASAVPVFANAVFVVLVERHRLGRGDDALCELDPSDPDVSSYRDAIADRRSAAADGDDEETIEGIVRSDDVTSTKGVVRSFPSLTPAELRQNMNDFFANGGYEYVTPRDKAYRDEATLATRRLVGDRAFRRVLDIGAGDARVLDCIGSDTAYVGIDIAELAFDHPQFAAHRAARAAPTALTTADGRHLPFPDGTFDAVLIIETIEHLLDPDVVVRECHRVLEPGGVVIANSANPDSLHQVLQKALGYPPFLTNHHHLQEFRLPELVDLFESAGFMTTGTSDCFLFPFYGVPGVDEHVRTAVDHDANLVEACRLIGRVAGDYSYSRFVRVERT